MPTNTSFNPKKVQEFDKDNLIFNAQSASSTVTAGQTKNIDLYLSEDHLLTGVWFVTQSGNSGDKVSLQVIDTDGIRSPAGTVLAQLVTGWCPAPNTSLNFDLSYPAKVFAGMTIRLIYDNNGLSSPFVAINYKLHKILS